MVNDIRPLTPLEPEDQNKSTPKIAPEEPVSPKLDEPIAVSRRPFEAPAENSNENGFVVLPNGKGIKKNPFKKPVDWFKNLSKRNKIIFVAATVLVLVAVSGGAYAMLHKNEPPPPPPEPVAQKVEEPPKPTTEASRLTGVEIPIEQNKRPVTSIQIENSPDARPQSGLLQAGVVYEAIAEGGITRFNASFMEAQPDYIGPIRSVRPYYAELAAPFDPIFVHAGGSAAGIAKIAELGLKDLDHGANAAAFQRVSDRFAPHNLYSSTAALDQASAARGYTTSDVKSFARKAEEKGKPPTASAINMTISSALYNVSYAYDPASNTYLRTMGGRPHTDQKSGTQIAPKVVIGMVSNFSQDGIYSVYQTTGSGPVFIFQDGQVTQGTWTKASAKDQIVFTDAAGNSIPINPGQTWITLLKQAGQVSFTP